MHHLLGWPADSCGRCVTQALVKVLRKRKGGPVRVKALRRKVRAPPAVPVFRVLGTDY